MNTLSIRSSTIFLAVFAIIILPLSATAQVKQYSALQQAVKHISDTARVKAGVAVYGLNFNAAMSTDAKGHYPMQSTYKFPLAMAILHRADQGELSLQQVVSVSRAKLDLHTWSPMIKDFPGKEFSMTIEQLLIYAVSKSDNNACDILFRLAGGTTAVNKYIRSIGVKDMNIAATEAEMKKAWKVQYTNWCRPEAMVQLLKIFYEGKVLHSDNTALLMTWMTETANSADRLKGLLPEDVEVAHKTGTSNTSKQGITAATNDVGIITLPDGRRYAIAVFVTDYKGGVPRAEHIIAVISKIVYDYFMQHKS